MIIANYAGDELLTLDNPQWGYSTDIHLPIISTRVNPNIYDFLDIDSTGVYDYRCVSLNEIIPTSQKTTLNSLLRSNSYMRCEKLVLKLGDTPSGFFPFAPDYGDKGNFCIQLKDRKQGGILLNPRRYWSDNLEFVYCPDEAWPKPTYALPTEVDEGSFEIGDVDGLLYPQEGYNPESLYNHGATSLSRSGIPSVIDGPNANDNWITGFNQQCNQSKAAALINFLVSSDGRTNTLTYTTKSYSYPLGIDNGDGEPCSVKMLGSDNTGREIIINCKHDRFNRFTIPMKFLRVEV